MGHVAACLGSGGEHTAVLVSGGVGGRDTFSDMWLLNPQSGKMEKVRILSYLTN